MEKKETSSKKDKNGQWKQQAWAFGTEALKGFVTAFIAGSAMALGNKAVQSMGKNASVTSLRKVS